jgi:glycosyltransferase involved in cell wall biosynthesis
MQRQQGDPDRTRRVLVVMPTLGQRVEGLRRAIDSVEAQEGVDTRLVVVAPETSEVAAEAASRVGATLVPDPRKGLSAAVNAGLDAQDGEAFYAWLNDDDYLLPGGLARLVGLLEERPDAVVAFGGCRYVDNQDRRIGVSAAGNLAHRIQPWGPNLVPQPAALTRLEAINTAGRYDEALKYAMDLDMFLRLRPLGPFASTRDEIAAFQWHDDSLTVGGRGLSVTEAQQVKRRYLPRRLRRLAPVWDLPVRWATYAAGVQVGRKAAKAASRSSA